MLMLVYHVYCSIRVYRFLLSFFGESCIGVYFLSTFLRFPSEYKILSQPRARARGI